MKTVNMLALAALTLCAAHSFAATHTEVTKAPRLPFMRGMGFECGFDGTTLGNRLTYLDPQSTYDGLAAKGFDHVRLPVGLREYTSYDSSTGIATLLETTTISSGWFGGTTAGPGFAKFDEIIDMAEKAGLYIIFDFHNIFDINPADAAQTNQFIAIWRAVAERYKDRSNKLIFELANEPNTHDYSRICTLQKNAIKEIRKTNPTRLILFDPGDASQPWVLTQCRTPPNTSWVSLPANDNNIAVVVHSYNPGWFTHQGESWANNPNMTKTGIDENYYTGTNSQGVAQYTTARKTLKSDLKYCQQYLDATGVPLVMNEFNVSSKLAEKSDITEYLSMITRWCESNNVPWAPWSYYARNSGFDCTDSNGNLYDYREAGLFPDLKTTNRFATDDYPHAVDITFSGYSGSAALTNFPVLVKLSEAGIYGFHYSDFTKTNGYDLCFTDASGKLLAHEIDTWSPNGVSTVWVKVPSLTASTKIVARYGCAKPIVHKVESVWDENYVGVWHMGEQKLPLADSSNVSRDVTSRDGDGIVFGAEGIIGGSVDFGAAGGSRCVNTDDHKELDGFQKMTIEAWTYQTSRPTGSDKNTGIIGKRNSAGSEASYYIYDSGADQKSAFYVASSGSSPQSAGKLVPAALNTWNHQVHTFDGSQSSDNAKGYLNGAYQGAGTANVSQIFAGAAELHIGNFQSGDSRNFPGKIDEVRISKCVRSADWIKASYDTVAKADFATYAVDGVASPDGPEEPVLPPVEYGPLATNQYAKSMNVLFAGAPNNATLTNFPVLVKLSAAIDGFSYADFRRPNGGDLRFADANGNLLPHEIDTWNSNGVSTAWVKIPALTRGAAITAHYGYTGSGSPAAVDAKDVWDDDYVGVWHLGEGALPMKESSETSSDFTSSYGATVGYGADGIVGRSVDFPAGGLTNALVAADHDALDGFSEFTIETWTFQETHKTNAGIIAKRKAYNNACAYYVYDSGETVAFCVGTNRNTAARWSFNQNQNLGEWMYLAYTADMASSSKNVHGYKNGAMNGWEPDVSFFGTMPNSAEPLVLGNLGANNKDQSFNGKIDEVRISKTVRSKEWVKATCDTIADAGFAVCSLGEIDLGEDITNLLLKASTDKANPIDYVENEDIRFDFRLDGVATLPLEVRAKEPLHVIWTRTADDGVTVKGTNAISLAQGCSVTTKLSVPGIVKMTATLVGSDYKAFSYVNPADGKTKNITFGGGAGVATEKMQLTTVEPADFGQFWAEAKAKLATVPFDDSTVELVNITPSSASNNFTIYAAKVPCFGPRPVTGWLTIPKNVPAGGLPIQASFDGYGCVSAIPKAPTWGYSANVHFHINAHGYDVVNRDNQYYKDFNDSINKTGRPLNSSNQPYGYAQAPSDYDNPTNTYFYYMAMRVMRAFDYLKSRPEWNGRDVIASGGSQGGLQTMWAGGLVDGITMIKPSITWGCDIGCPWNGKVQYPSRTWGIPSVEGAFYFDSALHAKRVPRNCVAEITRLGMGDYTCPPRGVLLSYYNMKCAVSATLVQGSDHGYVPPSPNQTFKISKAAAEEILPPTVADAAGFDWTNRVVTVTGAQAGKTVTLSLSGRDGTSVEYTATADSSGSATFNVQTAPGASYSYTVTQEGAAPASGSFSSGAWKDPGTWFAGAVENNALVASGGNWVGEPTVAASGNALEGDASFVLDADAVETGSNRLVRVDFDIVSGQFCLEADLRQEEGAMFGCIAAVACSGGNAWFAYDGSAWQRLYGDYTLAEDAAYIVRAELDLAQGEKGAVRYFVSDNGGTSFAPLFADASSASAWIPCNAADSRAVKSVTTEGTKTLASVGGSLMGADVAEADGVGYESLADAIAASTNSLALLTNATWPSDTPVGTIAVNLGGHSLAGVTLDGSGKVVVGDGYSAIPGEGKINISLAQAAALGVSTDGKSPAEIASALAANGANGIPLWKSYALGLDPADATAKPKATIVMNGENVELALVGITVNTASGATVTYKAYKSADLADMANAEPASGDKAVDATASVPKGASEDRMFYQLKVDVKGY